MHQSKQVRRRIVRAHAKPVWRSGEPCASGRTCLGAPSHHHRPTSSSLTTITTHLARLSSKAPPVNVPSPPRRPARTLRAKSVCSWAGWAHPSQPRNPRSVLRLPAAHRHARYDRLVNTTMSTSIQFCQSRRPGSLLGTSRPSPPPPTSATHNYCYSVLRTLTSTSLSHLANLIRHRLPPPFFQAANSTQPSLFGSNCSPVSQSHFYFRSCAGAILQTLKPPSCIPV
ncbi:uncharacterized protein EI97DRAFT_280672 [Westerdykella ornata]|uniref:Uncharacterized protein n=1 Tax=Westerdykella ornata TaxID=318751 RepID=A0A6A6JQ17_WESOR|nr:uncharacterized protein EI97DRAFT_280672 [Westerdykella ornata]KAF2277998.1 hypothetical protein EI97DRAFT_280672 [Westerdykella ornata]